LTSGPLDILAALVSMAGGVEMAIREVDLIAKQVAGKIFTHEEYMKLDYDSLGVQLELIDGEIYFMAAPLIAHQEISGNLYNEIKNFLKGKKCKVFYAPFAVSLEKDKGSNSTVQPDLVVICDADKIKNGKVCYGAPDMVIEILSPSNAKHDKMTKYVKYEQAGVSEFWIVDPEERLVEAYILRDGSYISKRYDEKCKLPCTVLNGLEIDLAEIFPIIEEDENNQ